MRDLEHHPVANKDAGHSWLIDHGFTEEHLAFWRKEDGGFLWNGAVECKADKTFQVSIWKQASL